MHLLWFVPSFGDQARLGDASTLVSPSLEHLVGVARAAEAAGFEGTLVPTGGARRDAEDTVGSIDPAYGEKLSEISLQMCAHRAHGCIENLWVELAERVEALGAQPFLARALDLGPPN